MMSASPATLSRPRLASTLPSLHQQTPRAGRMSSPRLLPLLRLLLRHLLETGSMRCSVTAVTVMDRAVVDVARGEVRDIEAVADTVDAAVAARVDVVAVALLVSGGTVEDRVPRRRRRCADDKSCLSLVFG